jgi:hypothetical protein
MMPVNWVRSSCEVDARNSLLICLASRAIAASSFARCHGLSQFDVSGTQGGFSPQPGAAGVIQGLGDHPDRGDDRHAAAGGRRQRIRMIGQIDDQISQAQKQEHQRVDPARAPDHEQGDGDDQDCQSGG